MRMKSHPVPIFYIYRDISFGIINDEIYITLLQESKIHIYTQYAVTNTDTQLSSKIDLNSWCKFLPYELYPVSQYRSNDRLSSGSDIW